MIIFVDGEPTRPDPSFMMRRGAAGQSIANSQWRNVTSGLLVGEMGVAQNVASGASNSGGQGIAVAILAPSNITQVRLETLNVSGTGPTVGDASFGSPWALIEVL